VYRYKAKIVNVVDGDTVDAVIDIGFKLTTTQRLRLYGVNTPELRSSNEDERALANKAKEYTTNTLLSQEVLLTTYKTDAFGRYLTTIHLTDYTNFNRTLIEKGYAKPYMQNEGAL